MTGQTSSGVAVPALQGNELVNLVSGGRGKATTQEIANLGNGGASSPTIATMTSGSSMTMATTTLLINKTIGSATSITLPASPVTAIPYNIKDAKGDAATNNITIIPQSGTIDGISSFVIAINKESVSLMSDGTNWWAT